MIIKTTSLIIYETRVIVYFICSADWNEIIRRFQTPEKHLDWLKTMFTQG